MNEKSTENRRAREAATVLKAVRLAADLLAGAPEFSARKRLAATIAKAAQSARELAEDLRSASTTTARIKVLKRKREDQEERQRIQAGAHAFASFDQAARFCTEILALEESCSLDPHLLTSRRFKAQMAALFHAAVIAYAAPFKRLAEEAHLKPLSPEIIPPHLRALHDYVISLRDTVIAHRDFQTPVELHNQPTGDPNRVRVVVRSGRLEFHGTSVAGVPKATIAELRELSETARNLVHVRLLELCEKPFAGLADGVYRINVQAEGAEWLEPDAETPLS